MQGTMKVGAGGSGGLVFGIISPPALLAIGIALLIICMIIYACKGKWWDVLGCVAGLALAFVGAAIQVSLQS